MANVTRDKEMAVSKAALFQAISEFERYPEFLGEVVSAKILPGATAEKTQVKFEIEVVKRFVYVLEFKIKGQDEVSWSLVESDFFKKNEGKWVLTESGPKSTKVHYQLEVGFGFLVPSWVSKKLTEVNLPKMFDSFESQAMKNTKG